MTRHGTELQFPGVRETSESQKNQMGQRGHAERPIHHACQNPRPRYHVLSSSVWHPVTEAQTGFQVLGEASTVSPPSRQSDSLHQKQLELVGVLARKVDGLRMALSEGQSERARPKAIDAE